LDSKHWETKEISIVYLGSQDILNDWILTNPILLTDTPPKQIQDAIDFYYWVNDNIANVSFITGNSLVGTLMR